MVLINGISPKKTRRKQGIQNEQLLELEGLLSKPISNERGAFLFFVMASQLRGYLNRY